jgi:uncharacterized protein Yka (UPF0111/DUF47 family)
MNKVDKAMFNTQVAALDEVKGYLDAYREDQQETFDALSDKMQESEKGARIAHRIEMLEQASDSIESAMDNIDQIFSGETP